MSIKALTIRSIENLQSKNLTTESMYTSLIEIYFVASRNAQFISNKSSYLEFLSLKPIFLQFLESTFIRMNGVLNQNFEKDKKRIEDLHSRMQKEYERKNEFMIALSNISKR